MAQRRGLLRTVRRSMEELYATYRIAGKVGLYNAVQTFQAKADIQIMNRNGGNACPAVQKRLINKHRIMNTYFDKTFSDFVKTYNFDTPLEDCDPDLRSRIWICWWQGVEQAPDLVKACIRSVQKNAGNHTVTIITEENYRNYVNFPRWIVDKYTAGIISKTHFSDLLRLYLLAHYGGMWLDATFFCRGENLDSYFSLPMWSIKRPGYNHISVASGNFATYSLCCAYESRWIFSVVYDFLQHYWKENDFLVDYLVFDYMIVLAQKNNTRMEESFANVRPNNPECDELIKVLNQPYDDMLWNKMKKDTYLFKLTWKQKFIKEVDGKETFYAKLIKGEL